MTRPRIHPRIVAGVKGSTAATDAQVSIDAVKVGTTISGSPTLTLAWRSASSTIASGGRYATSDRGGPP